MALALAASFASWGCSDGSEERDMVTLDAIWRRILLHEGSAFRTKDDEIFTFKIDGEVIVVDRPSSPRIGKTQFGLALPLVPIEGPGEIHNLVFGPSYVWAVLHDDRIRGRDY